MYAENGKISKRQTFRLYVFDLIGISTLLLPPYLAKLSGSDGIWAILFGSALGYVYLRYLGYVLKKMETDMCTYLERSRVRWVKYVSYGFVLIHCCLTSGFAVYVFCNLMQYSLVKEVSYTLLLFVTVTVAAYSVSGGIENRARVYEVLFWFILIPYTAMMLMSVKDFEITYMNHFFESQPENLIKSVYLVFLFLLPLFFVLFLRGNQEMKGEPGKKIVKTVSFSLLAAVIILLVSYVLLLGNFGGKSLASMRFPVVTLMSTIQLKGNFLKRMDALMLAVWFFTLFSLINLHMHCGATMLNKIVRKGACFGVFAVSMSTFAVAVFLKTSATGVGMFLDYYSYVAVPVLVIGPGLILWCSNVKRAKYMVVLLIGILVGNLTGCGATELESRCFPMMVGVDYNENKGQVLFYENFPDSQDESKSQALDTEIQAPVQTGNDFSESKNNFEKTLNKVVDYNHIKVIVLGERLMNNETAYHEMLDMLARSEEFPRNTYVCVVEDVEALVKLRDKLPQEIGTYLEEYLENHEEKQTKLLSLGDLLDEEKNHDMSLLLPYLKIENGYVEWSGYYEIRENNQSIE